MPTKTKKLGVTLIILGLVSIVGAGGLWLYNDSVEKSAASYSRDMAQTLLERIALGQAGQKSDADGADDAGKAGDANSADGADDAGKAGNTNNESNEGPGDDEPGLLDASDTGDSPRFVIVGDEAYIGVLSIPALNLSLPVNRDMSDAALKKTPCRYSGSIEKNTLVIAAHRISKHFGKIESLSAGDPVYIVDTDGLTRRYRVVGFETVDPSDSSHVAYSGYSLTLFTCTYGGKARVVTRCALDE